jgi:hypothetical protein
MEKDKRGDMPSDLSCCPSPQSNVPCQIEILFGILFYKH